MANFEKKTIEDIHDNFIARYTTIRNKYGDDTPLLEKAVIESIAWALAGVIYTTWLYGVNILKQCFPQYCSLPILKLWGALVGVNYKYGTSEIVTLKMTDVTADTLSAQTVFYQLNTDFVYKTISQGQNLNGEITVSAQNTKSGVGNINLNDTLYISNPIAGISDSASVIDVIPGTNDEDKEVYRARVLAKFRRKSQGGSALDFHNWALDAAGVVDALPYTLTEGTVTLFLIGEGSGKNRNITGTLSPNPFPQWTNGEFTDYTGKGQMLEVAKVIEGDDNNHNRRPMTTRVELRNCTHIPYKIYITNLTTSNFNTEIKNAIITELDKKRPNLKVLNYNIANAKINTYALSNVVSEIIGNETFTTFKVLNSDNEEIMEETLGVGELPYLQELTINGVKVTI